jgi:hypothetical protein
MLDLFVAAPPGVAAIAGAVVVAVCLAAGMADKAEFFRSYLIAYLFWIGITLGSLALLMVQHLTGGRWALVIRRILEASSRTLPLMAVAALPLLVGMKSLYIWSRPGETDPLIVAKHFYLNPAFFTLRMVFYFAIWFTLAYFLNLWSRQEDGGGANVPLWMRMEGLSGIDVTDFLLEGCSRLAVRSAKHLVNDLRPGPGSSAPNWGKPRTSATKETGKDNLVGQRPRRSPCAIVPDPVALIGPRPGPADILDARCCAFAARLPTRRAAD